MSLVVDIEKKLGSFTLRTQFETDSGAMALLGASGCGKSVTLKCIAGIMTPDSGCILLDGETLFDSQKRINLPPQQRRVGYLFQQYALFPNMTVAQNIQCGIRTGSRAEKRQQVAELLRRFRLEALEKRYPAQLSGGQQQRVALARILASGPRAILLDEPFAALDSFLRWQLELELFELLSDFSGPVLWVSHDLGECCRNCQTVCVMESGHSGAVTDMDTLVRCPATQSAARLTGYRNFLPARRCAGGVCIEGWNITLPLEAAAEHVTVAVPNDAVSLGDGAYTACVSRAVPDLGSTRVLLCPLHNPHAPLLCLTVPNDAAPATGTHVTFGLHADRCLCYA